VCEARARLCRACELLDDRECGCCCTGVLPLRGCEPLDAIPHGLPGCLHVQRGMYCSCLPSPLIPFRLVGHGPHLSRLVSHSMCVCLSCHALCRSGLWRRPRARRARWSTARSHSLPRAAPQCCQSAANAFTVVCGRNTSGHVVCVSPCCAATLGAVVIARMQCGSVCCWWCRCCRCLRRCSSCRGSRGVSACLRLSLLPCCVVRSWWRADWCVRCATMLTVMWRGVGACVPTLRSTADRRWRLVLTPRPAVVLHVRRHSQVHRCWLRVMRHRHRC
jgi:hypothetical protein